MGARLKSALSQIPSRGPGAIGLPDNASAGAAWAEGTGTPCPSGALRRDIGRRGTKGGASGLRGAGGTCWQELPKTKVF